MANLGEPEGGPSARFLADQAAEHGVWVAGTCPEVPAGDDPRPFNSFVFAGPEGETHRYRKVHPFTYGGETKHFRAGTELVTFTIGDVRISPLVCYDLRFADEFWQLATTTDVFVVPANWPARAACTGRRCSRRGRSRTSPTSWAATGSARAGGSTTPATAASSTRSASCSPPPPATRRRCTPRSTPNG